MPAEQNLSNHARFFPPFHFFVIPMLLINLVAHIYRVVREGFSIGGVGGILFALALVVGFLSCRVFSLTVQDRVIRLEEQLRYSRLLPADLQARVSELSIGQIVSLRFASDAELPALARKVLDEKIRNRKAIKQMIQTWRPDHLRA
jgi:uncharacterized membrane protein YciS (DUF1049 family)